MASRKLNRAAQQLVRSRIIAGDTNQQIRQALKDAGHPRDITDQAFSPYRSSEEVLAAIRRRDEEAIQTGLSQRSERILRLAASAKRFERLLVDPSSAESFQRGVEKRGLVGMHKEYRETLKDLGALVDPIKPSTHLNIDWENLSDEQIDRLARGVPLELVLAASSPSGAGAAKAPERTDDPEEEQ
jgi:hypothetical protein